MTENVQRNREMEVNLLAAAKDAQWSAGTFLGPGSIKLVCPAKVNLVLAVGLRRADGYHEVRNVMHALALHDTLYLHVEALSDDDLARAAAELAEAQGALAQAEEEACAAGVPDDQASAMARGRVPRAAALLDARAVGGPADNLLVEIDLSDRTGQELQVAAADNLAFKAADRLARAVGRNAPEKVSLRIEKHIPAQGGLGGGSSNAAAVLVGLASKWDIAADDPRVMEVAQGLGADVAFFLQGGCQLLEGVGECATRTYAPSHQAVVLVRPAAGVSTAACYQRFDEQPKPVADAVLQAVDEQTEAAVLPLANNLSAPAEALLSELTVIRQWLAERAGEDNVLLCGSGSTTFALVDTFDQASALAVEASKQGWWARPTNLSGLRAAVLPGR